MGRGGRNVASRRRSPPASGASCADARMKASFAQHDAPPQQTATGTEDEAADALMGDSEAVGASSWWNLFDGFASEICYTIEDRFIIPHNISLSPPLPQEDDEENEVGVAAPIRYFLITAIFMAFASYSRHLTNLMNGASPVMGEILLCVSHFAMVTQEQLGWNLFSSGFLSPSNFDWSAVDASGGGGGNAACGAGVNCGSSNAAGSQAVRRQMAGGGGMGATVGGGAGNNAGGSAWSGAAGYASYSSGNIMRYLLGRKTSNYQRQETLRSYLYRSFYSPSAFLVEQTCWFIVLISIFDIVSLQRIAVAAFFGNGVSWAPVHSVDSLVMVACALLFLFMYWIPAYEVDDAVLSVLFMRTSLHHILSAYCASLCITLLFAESMLCDELRRTLVATVFLLPEKLLRLCDNRPAVARGFRICAEVWRDYFYFVDFYFFLGIVFWFSLVLLESAICTPVLGVTALLVEFPLLVGCGWTTAPVKALKDTLVYIGFYGAIALVVSTIVPRNGIPFLSNAVQAAIILMFMVSRCEHKQSNGCAYVLIWMFMLAVYLYQKLDASHGAAGSSVWGLRESAPRASFASAVPLALQDFVNPDAETLNLVQTVYIMVWQLLLKGIIEDVTLALHFNVTVLGLMLILSTSVRAVVVEGVNLERATTNVCAAVTSPLSSAAPSPVPSSGQTGPAVAVNSTTSATSAASKNKSGSVSSHSTKASLSPAKSLGRSSRQDLHSGSAANPGSSDPVHTDAADGHASTAISFGEGRKDHKESEKFSASVLPEDDVGQEVTVAAVVDATARVATKGVSESAAAAAEQPASVEIEKAEVVEAPLPPAAVKNQRAIQKEGLVGEYSEEEVCAANADGTSLKAFVETTLVVITQEAPAAAAALPGRQHRLVSPFPAAEAPISTEGSKLTAAVTAPETEGREATVEAALGRTTAAKEAAGEGNRKHIAATKADVDVVESSTLKVVSEVNSALENASLTSPVSQSNESSTSLTSRENGRAAASIASKTSGSSLCVEEPTQKGRRQREKERRKLQLEADAVKHEKPSNEVLTAKTTVAASGEAPASVAPEKASALPLPRSQIEGIKKNATAAETSKISAPTKAEKSEITGSNRLSQPAGKAMPTQTNASKVTAVAVETANGRGDSERRNSDASAAPRATENKKQGKAESDSGHNRSSLSSSCSSVPTLAASKEAASGNAPTAGSTRKSNKSPPTVAPFPVPKPRHEQAVPEAPVLDTPPLTATPEAPPTAVDRLRRSGKSATPSVKEARGVTPSTNPSASKTASSPRTTVSAAPSATTATAAASPTAAATTSVKASIPPSLPSQQTTDSPISPSVPLPRSAMSAEAAAKKESPNTRSGYTEMSINSATAAASVEKNKLLSKAQRDLGQASSAPLRARGMKSREKVQVGVPEAAAPLKAPLTESSSARAARAGAAASAVSDAAKGVSEVNEVQPAAGKGPHPPSAVVKSQSPIVAEEADESYDLDRVLNFLNLKVSFDEDDADEINSTDWNRDVYRGEAFFDSESLTTMHGVDTHLPTVPAQVSSTPPNLISNFSTLPQPPEHVASIHNLSSDAVQQMSSGGGSNESPLRLSQSQHPMTERTAKAGETIFSDSSSDTFSPSNAAQSSGSFHVFSTHPQGAAAAAVAASAAKAPGSSGLPVLSPLPVPQSKQRPVSPNKGVTMQRNNLQRATQGMENDGVASALALSPTHTGLTTPSPVYYLVPQQTSPSPLPEPQPQRLSFNVAAMSSGSSRAMLPDMAHMSYQHHNSSNSGYENNNSCSRNNSSATNSKPMCNMVGGLLQQGDAGAGIDQSQSVFSRLHAMPSPRGAIAESVLLSPPPSQGSGMHTLQGQPSSVSGSNASPMMVMMMNGEGQMTLFPMMYTQPVFMTDLNGMVYQAQGTPQQPQIVYTTTGAPSGAMQVPPNAVPYQGTQDCIYTPRSPPGPSQGMPRYSPM
ncbi:hypothetical protein ABL78_1887 [Leptomonas seymouri]|uniref:Transmembrane protein n=1 Tax=Leptomonas seymouri TaxID=5684 RepID=A0A0N1I1K5_LEPSE|nr:hypothetical protein ABL78_1887 [Leptomonas seymouri]|eukprot:KPI89003.1 hypothetical protein ABL78_1887 [Leptomonas seymouri]